MITTPVVGARAQSLVGELRSHAEQGGQILKKKKRNRLFPVRDIWYQYILTKTNICVTVYIVITLLCRSGPALIFF